MAQIDDDPATPDALQGVFDDAQELGRAVHVFAFSIERSGEKRALDGSLLHAIAILSERSDIDACAGSVTVLMSGEPAAILVARPLGQPGLRPVGDATLAAVHQAMGGDNVQVAVGMATTLEHRKLTLTQAIAVAVEGLLVAQASGQSRAVHSELYELTLAAQKRSGQIFPLEGVNELDHSFTLPAPELVDTTLDPHVPGTAAAQEEFDRVVMEAAHTGALLEVDDPFAHGSGAGRPIDGASALSLTNGIAPAPEIIAKLELDSRAEVERLKLELEVVRREPAEAVGDAESENKRERRIKKLLVQLEAAEEEIARLRKEREADAGVPSRFKRVQGLDPAQPNAPVKRTLIDGVFESNQDGDQK